MSVRSHLFAGAAAAVFGLLASLAGPPLAAQPALPGALEKVGFDQRLGETVPAALEFTDHAGRAVTLGDYLGERPVLVVPVYYGCPMLCGLVLNGLTQTLRTLDFTPGREFGVVVVSFDPDETPAEAAESRAAFLRRYGRPEGDPGWAFLTGSAASISGLTEAIGFRYRYDETAGEFAHAAGLAVLTPDGRIARYFFGVEYPPRHLRLALVEAADERIGSLADQIFLYCFRYDPTTGRYSAVTMNLVRIGGVATLLALGLFVTLSLRREHRPRPA